MTESKSLSCNLKNNQKVFFIDQNIAYSCCRSHPVGLTDFTDLTSVIQHWSFENQQLELGVKVDSCKSCWQDEENNLPSYRMQFGQQPQEHSISLGLSNACNQMCSYCSAKHSSTWQNSIETLGNFSNVSGTTQKNLIAFAKVKIDPDKWIQQIRQHMSTYPDRSINLSITGGEPLMQKTALQKLLSLVDTKIKHITVHSNLNPPDNKFLVWLLENYTDNRLRFAISIDAVPDFNHLPRAGFDKTKFNENFKILIDNQIPFTFFTVSSVLNFFDMPNFVKWLNHNKFTVRYTKINNPDCLDPVWIPRPFADVVLSQIEHVPQVLQNLTPNANLVDIKLKEQYNYLTQYFERTGTDVNTTNAEFNQYWAWLEERFK